MRRLPAGEKLAVPHARVVLRSAGLDPVRCCRERDPLRAVEPRVFELARPSVAVDGEDAELVAQIKETIDTKVRPAVAQDGGDIIFKGFDASTGIVSLHMQGSCAGCPSSTATLQHGIQNLLKHFVPDVVEVRPM